MIKIFRKIRQNSMMENKTGKYVKYAVGEIFLVMIGILLALQVNTWNQQRIQNTEEQQALKNLIQDFEYNLSALDSSLVRTSINIENQFVILDHTGNKPRPETEFEFNVLLNSLTDSKEFFPRDGYLKDLTNSGKLGIIKNEDLRNKLSSWNAVYDNIKLVEGEVRTSIDRVGMMVINAGSWLNSDAAGSSQTIKDNTFPKSGFNVDNRSLLNELAFENNTENTIYQNDKLTQRQKRGVQLITEILELLEKEIQE